MTSVRLRHDNTGQNPGWYVDKLSIEDMESMLTYDFPCRQWLAVDEGDGAISRELPVEGKRAGCFSS
jgi:PLAT/LH2 domain